MKKFLLLFFWSFAFVFLSNAQNIALYGVKKGCTHFQDGICWFEEDGKYGAINTNGNVVIAPSFKNAHDFVDGVAVVETETGEGLITRNGVFLLQPLYKISREDKSEELHGIKNLFIVEDPSTKLKGVFYKNRFVIPIEFSYIDCTLCFPFAQVENQDHINLETGENFGPVWFSDRGDYILGLSSEVSRFFNFEGQEMSSFSLSSSKSISCFKDSETGLYGLKDKKGEIIVNPESRLISPGWIDDTIILRENRDGIEKVYDSNGHAIIEGQLIFKVGNFFRVLAKNDDAAIFNIKGKELLRLSDAYAYDIMKGWMAIAKYDGSEFKTINLSNGQIFDRAYFYDNGVLRAGTSDYINPTTGRIINTSKYDYVYFKNGYGYANDKDYNKYLLDMNGRVLMKDCEQYRIISHSCSEGVVQIRHDDYGYCFAFVNGPLKEYNQTNYTAESERVFLDKGYNLFAKKKYTEAKDLYYRVMLSSPTNVEAIIGYGACLQNLGYYDSAIDTFLIALEIDPQNKLAQEDLEIAQKNKAYVEYKESKRASAWDGIATFLNVLSTVSNQYLELSQSVNSSEHSIYGTTNNSTKNNSSYNNSGSTVNTSSLNTDRYTYNRAESELSKMCTFREYYSDSARQEQQRIMRSIRTKWEGRGQKMYHSPWEDWTGGPAPR